MAQSRLFEVTSNFLDRDHVKKAVDAATLKAMSKAGGMIMRDARRSMKPLKNPSKPGRPPRTIRGDIKSKLFYSFDPRTKDVVVGPYGYPNSRALTSLEFGGRSRFKKRRRFKSGTKTRRSKKVNIAARPFMRPSLARKMDKIPPKFRNTVRASRSPLFR